jgi:hypothetical protein
LVEVLPKGTVMDDAQEKEHFADQAVELVTQGHVAAVKEVQEILESAGVPARILPVDEEAPMHQMFRLEIVRADLERARQVLGARWLATLEAEGVAAPEGGAAVLDAGAETTCPACSAKFKPHSAATAECPDCGLFLGVPA